LLPKPADTVWMQAVDERGRLVHDLQTTTPGFSIVTGVREHAGAVWLGSLQSTAIATFAVPPGPSNPRALLNVSAGGEVEIAHARGASASVSAPKASWAEEIPRLGE
jgi:hypothetical protein